jgi:sugar/nucleoside kinase (ribokinase family)
MTRRIAACTLRPTILGTGLVALDVVCNVGSTNPPRHFAGGTCGNVLSILGFMGWRALPVSRLAPGKPAELLQQDLRQWSVATDFVSVTADGSTPVIFHRIGRRASGESFHYFSWRCPACGAHLPGYKPVLAIQAQTLAETLPVTQVFFFDRVSRGALDLANKTSEQGAVVVFEPSGVGDPTLFREAWSLAHIVKYSHERLREIADIDLKASERQGLLLEIETLGVDGLRFRSHLPHAKTKGWVRQPAFKVDQLKDAAGSGDWCTAAVLRKLARSGLKGLRRATGAAVVEAMCAGQAWAAWNCSFEGARGGMYEVGLAAAEAQVKRIMESGEAVAGVVDKHIATGQQWLSQLCPACKKSDAVRSVRRKVTAG